MTEEELVNKDVPAFIVEIDGRYVVVYENIEYTTSISKEENKHD